MAGKHTINIHKGKGTTIIPNGTYNVTCSVDNYDNSTIEPKSVTISDEVETYEFTISANGTLTLHVSDDGTPSGEPIIGATFIRCDVSGNTYGDIITSNDMGNAIFNNVPYRDTFSITSPKFYYKQLSSDGCHNFDDLILTTTITSSNQTEEIFNESALAKSFILTDANYPNLLIKSGEITLE